MCWQLNSCAFRKFNLQHGYLWIFGIFCIVWDLWKQECQWGSVVAGRVGFGFGSFSSSPAWTKSRSLNAVLSHQRHLIGVVHFSKLMVYSSALLTCSLCQWVKCFCSFVYSRYILYGVCHQFKLKVWLIFSQLLLYCFVLGTVTCDALGRICRSG